MSERQISLLAEDVIRASREYEAKKARVEREILARRDAAMAKFMETARKHHV